MITPSLLDLLDVLAEVQATAKMLKDKIASINRARSVEATLKEDLVEALVRRDQTILSLEEANRNLQFKLKQYESLEI